MPDQEAKKIGILGGSFNPIHVGHLSIAQQVADALDLDNVLLIPAGRPPHKSAGELAPARDRLEMCRLAAAGLRELEVSDIEIRREETSYTIETIRALREKLGSDDETFFIIGADTVRELPTWYRIEDLVELTRWAIVQRPKSPSPDFDALKEHLPAKAVRKLRRGLVRIKDPVDVSSTEIRKRLAAGKGTRGLLRKSVEEYILRRGLYGQ